MRERIWRSSKGVVGEPAVKRLIGSRLGDVDGGEVGVGVETEGDLVVLHFLLPEFAVETGDEMPGLAAGVDGEECCAASPAERWE
jgi:hypothetical protein